MTATRERRIRPGLFLALLLMLLALSGCQGSREELSGQEENTEEGNGAAEDGEAILDQELYILLHCNPDTERLFFQNVDTGRQEEFTYGGGTYMYNRYGESTIASRIPMGTLVYLTYTEDNFLLSLEETTDAFLFEDMTDYRLDMEKAMITVLGKNYFYEEDLKVFSRDNLIALNEVSSLDALTIRGKGNKVVSIVVSRGHGTVSLKNTALFEGGMVSIGNVEAQVIAPDMRLEVPEGTYMLSVANDGYGGSQEITVNRFEELEVDLEPLKGEGPKYCQLTISAEPENTVVTLDGVQLDYSQVQTLKYGVYALKAKAEGYESWSGKLVVSSEEASMSIRLESLSDSKEDDDKDEEDDDDKDEDEDKDQEDDKDQEADSTGSGESSSADSGGTGSAGSGESSSAGSGN